MRAPRVVRFHDMVLDVCRAFYCDERACYAMPAVTFFARVDYLRRRQQDERREIARLQATSPAGISF